MPLMKKGKRAEQQKPETLEEILDTIPQEFLSIGIDHYSPTQLNCSIANWAYKYGALTQEQRRGLKRNINMYFGTTIGEITQLMFCDEMWTMASQVAPNKQKLSWDQALEYLDEMMKKYEPWDEKDKEKFEAIKHLAPDYLKQSYEGWNSLNMQSPIIAERNVRLKFNYVNCLGRIDGEDPLMLLEQKCRLPKLGRVKKDGTRSVISTKLPEDNPVISHARQTAFYHFCTKKRPFLLYVNDKEYKIFDSSNCDLLTKEAMEEHLEHYKRQARLRDRAILRSQGTVPGLLRDLDPDWEHNFEWDIGEDNAAHAKQLFKEAQCNE